MIAALAVLATLGCAGRETEPAWTGSIRDSAGVTLVVNPDEGLWKPSEAWQVEEDLRIGEFGADPEYMFGQIGSIALNSRGEILVMDRQLRQVRVFSPEGDFIRAFGSAGPGPEEFGRGVTDVFVGPGDTVLVPDTRHRSVHRYDPDGVHLGTEPLDMNRYRALRFRWNASTGRAAVQLRPARVLVDGDSASLDELRLLEVSGAVGDTLLRVPSGELLGPRVLRYFTPEPAWALTDSLTVLSALNSEYRIRFYDRERRLRRIVSKNAMPRPITDRDVRAFFAYLDQAWLAAGVPPARLPANHRRVSFADFFPAFAIFHVGYEGSLWVQPVRAPGDLSNAEIERYNFIEDFGGSDWDVFDRNGRFLGVVTMPRRFQPRTFIDDAIYGVSRDDFDVQYAVRLRIVRGEADG